MKKILQKHIMSLIQVKNAATQRVDTPGTDMRGWRWWPVVGQQYLALGCTHREEMQQGPLTPSLWTENF